MLTPDNPFYPQVRLLVGALPFVARERCFALKGGTAINLFVRDLPRLSVDIDLAFVPIGSREAALAEIDAALRRIGAALTGVPSGYRVRIARQQEGKRYSILVSNPSAEIKIEVTPVLRGSVFPEVDRRIVASAEAEFGFAEIQVLSFEDLYAGKIVAALDRQHPRDLFDVKLLLETEGISDPELGALQRFDRRALQLDPLLGAVPELAVLPVAYGWRAIIAAGGGTLSATYLHVTGKRAARPTAPDSFV